MTYLAPLLIWTIIPAAAALAQSTPFDEGKVRASCEAEWPDDYSMQEYCFRQHEEGHARYIQALGDEDDEGMLRAFQNCERDWLPEWGMVAYCADQQLAGRLQLRDLQAQLPEDVAEKILGKCRRDWPDDLAMTAYCAGVQAASWRALNQ